MFPAPVSPPGTTRPPRAAPDESSAPRLRFHQRLLGPTEKIDLDRQGRLTVTTELARLLGLPRPTVDLNAGAFSPARPKRADARVSHNVPAASHRFLRMPLPALLMEVLQRAIGDGPPDPTPGENPGMPAHERRLGDMLHALSYGRPAEVPRLRHAAYALHGFIWRYRERIGDLRAQRPDLAAFITPWALDIARNAVTQALALPLAPGDEPRYAPERYDELLRPLQQPLAHHIGALEARRDEQRTAELRREIGALFRRMAGAHPPAAGVTGADQVAFDHQDTRLLLRGIVEIRCTAAELPEWLRAIPAGVLRLSGGAVDYPGDDAATTLQALRWQDPCGRQHAVMVAIIRGVHSYHLDDGQGWRPTGGHTSPALEAVRAEAWQHYLGERRNDYHRWLRTLGGWWSADLHVPRYLID